MIQGVVCFHGSLQPGRLQSRPFGWVCGVFQKNGWYGGKQLFDY